MWTKWFALPAPDDLLSEQNMQTFFHVDVAFEQTSGLSVKCVFPALC